jgi:hypothetical protein
MQVSLADYNKLQQVAHHGHELIQVIAVQHGLRVGRSLCGVAAGALSRAPPALLTLFLMYVCVQQVQGSCVPGTALFLHLPEGKKP